jgi:hypothetical protein
MICFGNHTGIGIPTRDSGEKLINYKLVWEAGIEPTSVWDAGTLF